MLQDCSSLGHKWQIWPQIYAKYKCKAILTKGPYQEVTVQI